MKALETGKKKKCQENLEIVQDLIDACERVEQDVRPEKEMLSRANDLMKREDYNEVERLLEKMNRTLRHKTKTSIIRESVKALSGFRRLCRVAGDLGVLKNKDRDLMESIEADRNFSMSLEDWKGIFNRCNDGIESVRRVLEDEYRHRMNEISDALEMGEEYDMEVLDVDVLLELAREELDRNEYLNCYDFLSPAIDVNKKVLQTYIGYANEIRKAERDLKAFKEEGKLVDISQLEQLIELARDAAKGGDYGGALEVVKNLTGHIARLRESGDARERISNLRLRVLDLKDICPDHLDKRGIFSSLDSFITKAKVEYNSEEYISALSILDEASGELEKVDRHVRREYCLSLLNKCQELIKDVDLEIDPESKRAARIRESIEMAYELFTIEKFGDASLKAELCYDQIRTLLRGEGEKYISASAGKLEKLLDGLREHRLDTPELDELYERFETLRAKGNYLKCKPLVTELEDKVHIRYRNFINRKLEAIKDKIELAVDLGDEIDELTSGLIIVQENFDNRNYEKSLEILDRVTEKVDAKNTEIISIKEDLATRLKKATDTLSEMTRRGEDVEGLFKALENIESLVDEGNIVKARRVCDKLDAAIYGTIDNHFLNIDVLKTEMEGMGLKTEGIFDNLVVGRQALARDQYFLAYSIAMDIKGAIKELERSLLDPPGPDFMADEPAPPKTPEMEPEEDAREVPREVSLVPVGRIEEEGILKSTDELVNISVGGREQASEGVGRGNEESGAPDIVKMATEAKELLDVLTGRGVDIGYLEREIELAMRHVELDEWGEARKHLELCIEQAKEDLAEKGSTEGVKELRERIDRGFDTLASKEGKGIVLGKARKALERANFQMKMGDIDGARSSLREFDLVLETKEGQYEDLVDEISHIQTKLSQLMRENVDVGFSRNLFDNIKTLTREGQYTRALDLCEQCRDELARREEYVREQSKKGPQIVPPAETAVGGGGTMQCNNCGRILDKPDNSFFATIICPDCGAVNLT